ncbi:hypothetical protein [Chitinophaga pinensis]|uniref:YD repeat-containing protein n=1 Tax=Chitinophaga pinensis (strain ATCC 43595 / DSM 2588 / LMG 13176 / NBRC 15968 / NCIMB 11800 / UQM 2034) TaxID=485918 RepID=A0A979GW00_CHIPD|nr:hypothetical protein [Chitinophaga pinensis]ACU63753.1 hypothetical protein Cpin_6349 [Chitinophaga pinensis DSM 2588]
MRTFLIIILTIWTSGCHAQTRKPQAFKKTTYSYIYSELYQQTTDTIATEEEPIDIYFFCDHLKLPYRLPKKLTDKQYAGKTISDNNPHAGSNVQSNWSNTYSYDSIGRLTNFSYSSCIACSSFPFSYAITYNGKGQIASIVNKLGLKERFEFQYNVAGDIIKLAKYSSELLEIEITSIH